MSNGTWLLFIICRSRSVRTLHRKKLYEIVQICIQFTNSFHHEGEKVKTAKLKFRKHDSNGYLIGRASPNPKIW